ncbi:PREDICTED: replication protein A 14 kDa subunit [Gavialis gangeticus]|uniref:replication protein A 14 kDa subunit n=1 Tax=Gavialis gangeticus TaxID=94835 RepID=UPI00092F8578|nr:PREDICTED: replication protein A 14 kDa subunit [Gavialis gangeticus]
MEDVHEGPRPRIATSQLAQHVGQPVCFVGRVQKIHPSGKMFVLSDGEGKSTTVELSEPLDEEISGVIEVVGRVTNQATIMCMSYVQFREDKSPFDLEMYNEALKVIQEFPEYFPFGIIKE